MLTTRTLLGIFLLVLCAGCTPQRLSSNTTTSDTESSDESSDASGSTTNSEVPAKVTVSAPSDIPANTCVPLTINLKKSDGSSHTQSSDLKIKVDKDTDGTLYSDSACTTEAGTTVTVPAGSDSLIVYYKRTSGSGSVSFDITVPGSDGTASNAVEVTNPLSTESGGVAVAVLSTTTSTITGTSNIKANGTDTSTVTITLKYTSGSFAEGVTPTFTATDTGTTNVYGACTATNSSGVSTCSLKSTTAETKTLSIATPISVSGGTVVFTPLAGVASVSHANGSTTADPGAAISIIYNTAMNAATLTSTNIVLKEKARDIVVLADYTYTSGTKTLAITPYMPLDVKKTYTLTSSTAVADADGTALSASTVTFTTGSVLVWTSGFSTTGANPVIRGFCSSNITSMSATLDGANLALTDSDCSDGGFKITPNLATDGAHTITVSGTSSGVTSTVSFSVTKCASLTEVTAAGSFPGGSGTESDPYWITTKEELDRVNADKTKHYLLKNDIDLSCAKFNAGNTAVIDSSFSGGFFGGGFAIKNLTVESGGANSAMFADHSGGIIKELKLLNVYINGAGTSGALIGTISNRTNQRTAIKDILVTGHVLGSTSVGGVVGTVNWTHNLFHRIRFAGSVYGSGSKVGGIVGEAGAGNGPMLYFNQNVAKASVSGPSSIGGILGAQNSWNATGSLILQSETLGAVFQEGAGGTKIGGLVGEEGSGGFKGTVIMESKSTAYVLGTNQVGGLVGYSMNLAPIIRSLFAGTYSASGADKGPIRGILATNTAPAETVYQTYYMGAGGAHANGGVSVTEADLIVPATFQATATSWDFSSTGGLWKYDTDAGGIPHLNTPCLNGLTTAASSTTFDAGDGLAPGTAYEVSSAAQVHGMRSDVTKYYKLTANITLGVCDRFDGIGVNGSDFTGQVDGNGKTITNLNIEPDDMGYAGFVRYIAAGGPATAVKDLTLKNLRVLGQDYVGGVTSSTSRVLTGVTVDRSIVFGAGGAGGLIQSANSTGIYSNLSLTNSTVIGMQGVGGVIYYATAIWTTTATGLSSTGSTIAGMSSVGGVVGLVGSSGTRNITLSSSSSNSTIFGFGGSNVGGIIGSGGSNAGGDYALSSLYFTGSIYGQGGSNYGGIIGLHRESAPTAWSKLYFTGTIKADDSAVRLGGIMNRSNNDNLELSDAYSSGVLSTTANITKVGCIAGEMAMAATLTVTRVYGACSSLASGNSSHQFIASTTATTATVHAHKSFYLAGASSCGADGVLSAVNATANLCGETAANMKAAATYTTPGWTFGVGNWQINEGVSYPTLEGLP